MRLVVLSFFIAAMIASSTRANEADARLAFEEGTLLFENGEYTKAAAAFREAYHLNPTWKMLYNIGQCEAAAGHYTLAMDAYEQYLVEGGDKIDAATQKETKAELLRLKSRESYRVGTVAFEKGEYEAAAMAFRSAYQKSPHWKVLYNIAQSEAAAAHFGLAMEAFEKYLALGGDNIMEERQNEVEAELDRLYKRVGFVDIKAPEGASVFVDGTERGTAPLPGRLAIVAGVEHDLQIVQDGRDILRRKIRVNGRQAISILVGEDNNRAQVKLAPPVVRQSLDKSKGKTSVPTKKKAGPALSLKAKWKKRMAPMGIALMATGGASVVASLITGAVALKRQNDLEEPCAGAGCLPKYHEKNDSIGTLSKTSNVLLISGAVVAAGGAVLFVLAKKRFGKEKVVALTPAVGSNSGGIQVVGRF
ncbi:MAG: tetratricopeptide repeat protein [Deltaproteobacteria bacterium]|nr:tetratricopeptide repeat protein [Deltaproteobacteria bacterium]